MNERGRYAWTGREIDVETALQYNRARYYDATTGRWISQDPLGFDAGDLNLYRYVANRPTTFSDPSGKIAPLVLAGIGIILVELAGTGAAYYGISEFDKANSMVAKIPAQNWGPANQKLYDGHVFNGKLGLVTAEISQTTTEAYLVMVPVGAAYRPFLVFGRAGTPLVAMSVKTIDAGIKISGVYMLGKEGLTVAKDLRSLDGSDDAFLKAYSSSGKLGGSILGGGLGLKSGYGLWDSKGAMGSMGTAGSIFGPRGEQFGRQFVAQLHVLEGLNRPIPNLTQKQIASLFGAANSSMIDSSFARILQIEQQLLARRVLSPERIAALEAELAALRGAPAGPIRLSLEELTPRMTLDPSRHQVFRGGTGLTAGAIDVQAAADGLIHPTRPNPRTGMPSERPQGLSLNINPASKNIQRFGGAYEVESIPDGLQIIRDGTTDHFVIAPARPMTLAQYQALLNRVRLANVATIP